MSGAYAGGTRAQARDPRLHPAILVSLATAAVLAAVVAFRPTPSIDRGTSAGAIRAMPSSPAIEQQFGVRISQVSLTADAGMLDLRYTVLDPTKAITFGHTRENAPAISTPRAPKTLLYTPAMLAHDHHLEAGRTYYLLYRNATGWVQRGDEVTIVVGYLRLEHVPVVS